MSGWRCLACESEAVLLGSWQGYRIYRCPNCGLGHTDNSKVQGRAYHRDLTYIQEEALFRNIFQKRVELISLLAKKGRVLEVGCSTGLMLAMLRDKGWQVEGVEISPQAAAQAKERGIEVVMTQFEKARFSRKFDLIIFNHTLEHLVDPKAVLEKAVSLLSHKGLIYIDLPNFGGLSARLRGVNWPLLLPEEHPWHFTLEAVEQIYSHLGLNIVAVDRSSGLWDFGDPAKELITSLVTFKKRFFGEIMTAMPSWLISKLGMGSDLMVLAQKD